MAWFALGAGVLAVGCSAKPSLVTAPTSFAASATAATAATADFAQFKIEFNSGASCARLFEVRNALSPKDSHHEEIKELLGTVDCMGPTAVRKTAITPLPASSGTPAPVNYVKSYQLNFMICADTPQRVYAEAGTRDQKTAAQYVGAGMSQGLAREGATDGCYDALLNRVNRFP